MKSDFGKDSSRDVGHGGRLAHFATTAGGLHFMSQTSSGWFTDRAIGCSITKPPQPNSFRCRPLDIYYYTGVAQRDTEAVKIVCHC